MVIRHDADANIILGRPYILPVIFMWIMDTCSTTCTRKVRHRVVAWRCWMFGIGIFLGCAYILYVDVNVLAPIKLEFVNMNGRLGPMSTSQYEYKPAPTSTSTPPPPPNATETAKTPSFSDRTTRTSIPGCSFSKHAELIAIANISYPKADASLPPSLLPLLLGGVDNSNSNNTVDMLALCLLDNDNTQRYWFGHFPHAAQSIFPCWSFFQRVRDQYPHAQLGFWINDDTITSPPRIRFRGSWLLSVVPQTGACTYQRNIPLHNSSLSSSNNPNHTLGYMLDTGITPDGQQQQALVYRLSNNVKSNWRAPEWFSRPEDAESLKRAVLGANTKQQQEEEEEEQHQQQQKQQPPLRIGLIQRTKDRRIINLHQIRHAIQKEYPHSTIDQVSMDTMDFFQQATWFAEQHVILSMHGAALTNIAFMMSGGRHGDAASLIEIFPRPFYELHYFRRLAQSIGMTTTATSTATSNNTNKNTAQQQSQRYFQWIDSNVTDPEAEYQASISSNQEMKHNDAAPPIDEIIALVHKAVASITITHHHHHHMQDHPSSQ